MNWEQLKTILWLRWRLTRNQWSRNGGMSAVIVLFIGVGALALGALCFTGALVGSVFGLGEAKPSVIMEIWFGVTIAFLLSWMIGLLIELQRSETIDLQCLMHLPAVLGQLFIVNYLVSHFTLSIIVMVPIMLGLGIGLAMARGPEMLLLIPLALSMIFMVTAWTYCLRGWLAAMMTNPRRRRTVIMGITLAFILLGQGPNLYFNVLNRNSFSNPPADYKERAATAKNMFNELGAVQGFIPPLWLPLGAQGLAEGNVWPALGGTLGGLGIAILGLRRAYRSTIRFYHGESGARTMAKIKIAAGDRKNPVPRAKNKKDFLEFSLPLVPEQATALALTTLRSLLRAPEVKMALASSVVSMVIVGAMVFLRSPPHLSEAMKPFVATGAVTFPVFMLIQFFANAFGFDRDGFRALILSPADRRLILLGKNLAALPIGFSFGGILLGLVAGWLRLPPFIIAAAFFQLVTALLIAGLGGNLLSILMPFRIQPGSMKPTKMPGPVMLVMILCQMLFPLAMTPVFAAPLLEFLWQKTGGPAIVPVNLISSGLLCGAMLLIYPLTLAPLGRLLQKRETKILGVVTVAVE